MKETALIAVGVVVGACSVLGGIGLGAALLWWLGRRPVDDPFEDRSPAAEQRIADINRQARDWILANHMYRKTYLMDDTDQHGRERRTPDIAGEWR